MKRYFLVTILLFSITFWSTADTYPRNPKVDILNYAFNIKLSDVSDEIVCSAAIEVLYKGTGVEILRLDLVSKAAELDNKGMTVSSITENGSELDFVHEDEVLNVMLPTPSEEGEMHTYVIYYSGIPASGLKIGENKYGDRTFFSDNWPDRGRNWLPMVDHPYDKATCEFIVTAPAHYQVVSNGLRIEETDLEGGMRLTHWKQSVPIATWLYVLGVARFAVQKVDEFDHKSIETWVYYQDREAGFYDFAVPTKSALEYYSQNVGPFVYEKLANIQSNSVGGGMEAASAILYSDRSVTGNRDERWRNIIIHEIAHQWFGNSVTEADWDDVWLSEGFATYFTALFIEHEYGLKAFQEKMASSKKTIYAFHEKNPDYRIVHDNLNDMSKVTSSHTYQKGAWILHMLRGIIGDDAFWEGIRSYYKRYMNSNATTTDFRVEMEKASGIDLEVFFDQWLYKSGALTLEGSWQYNARKKEITVRIDQIQKGDNLFQMPVQLSVTNPDGQSEIRVLNINKKRNTFSWTSAVAPEKIMLDSDNWVLMKSDFNRK